jgi:hypothetical protein
MKVKPIIVKIGWVRPSSSADYDRWALVVSTDPPHMRSGKGIILHEGRWSDCVNQLDRKTTTGEIGKAVEILTAS